MDRSSKVPEPGSQANCMKLRGAGAWAGGGPSGRGGCVGEKGEGAGERASVGWERELWWSGAPADELEHGDVVEKAREGRERVDELDVVVVHAARDSRERVMTSTGGATEAAWGTTTRTEPQTSSPGVLDLDLRQVLLKSANDIADSLVHGATAKATLCADRRCPHIPESAALCSGPASPSGGQLSWPASQAPSCW